VCRKLGALWRVAGGGASARSRGASAADALAVVQRAIARLPARLTRRGASFTLVDDWLARARRLAELMVLLDLALDVIPLPRALCVYRYRSADLPGGSAIISNWGFQESLKAVGFDDIEIDELDRLLTTNARIPDVTVEQFVHVLQTVGVTPDPSERRRKSSLWGGAPSLEELYATCTPTDA
jgi:hypothetical protein